MQMQRLDFALKQWKFAQIRNLPKIYQRLAQYFKHLIQLSSKQTTWKQAYASKSLYTYYYPVV